MQNSHLGVDDVRTVQDCKVSRSAGCSSTTLTYSYREMCLLNLGLPAVNETSNVKELMQRYTTSSCTHKVRHRKAHLSAADTPAELILLSARAAADLQICIADRSATDGLHGMQLPYCHAGFDVEQLGTSEMETT